MAQKIELEDFSGGVTDYYLSAPENKMRQCDNLLINQYQQLGKVFTRPGSKLYDAEHPKIITSSRINTCFSYQDRLYVQSGQRLFYYNKFAVAPNSKWTEIIGPLLSAFPGATGDDSFSYASWNYHTFITNASSFGYLMKITTADGIPMIRQAGLPKFPAGTVASNEGDTASVNNYKYYYKICYKQTYYAGPLGDTQFVDIGSPTLPIEIEKASAISPTKKVKLTNIPVLTNVAIPPTSYGLAPTKQIYRTKNNGTSYYLVGEIFNSDTEFEDVTTDEDLELGEPLYTNGGVVANDPPPISKCIHIKNDIAYYGNCDFDYYRVRQSIPGDPDSCPESFYLDLDDDIVAISSTKNNVVVLCKSRIYRIDGFFDELGRGGMVADRISDITGCISVQSVVQALDGVLWAGQDGVYYTDGFKVIKLNQDYDKTYQTFVSSDFSSLRNRRIQGKYDRRKNRVWWTVQDENGADLNKCYILDLNWGIRENATFTTASGKSFSPCAIEFINGDMIRCNQLGHVLIHQQGLYVDPVAHSSLPAAQWASEPIVYTLETSAYNFGTSATRKYVTRANITCESETNLALQITSNNDDDKVISDLLPIRYLGNIFWGEPDVYWMNDALIWNKQGLIHEKRLMPAKSLRCNYKSLVFKNASVAIVSSDIIGSTVDINATTKTVILNLNRKFPTKSIGYYIAFENDNYTQEYEIIAISGDSRQIQYSDLLNTSLSGTSKKWVMRGYPKGETLNLLNFSMIYEESGPSLNPYRTSDSGEVGS